MWFVLKNDNFSIYNESFEVFRNSTYVWPIKWLIKSLSDPFAQNEAAAVSVLGGSLSDPKDMPGRVSF